MSQDITNILINIKNLENTFNVSFSEDEKNKIILAKMKRKDKEIKKTRKGK